MGNIFTEGLASYIAKKVDEAYIEEGRKDYTPSFDVTYDQTDLDVTPENAEDLFRNDYHNLSHADRGAEYDYGKYFCEYLDTTFGPDYFVRVVDTLNKVEWSADYWGTPTEEDRNNRTEAIKQEFGEDIFVQFGKWFQKHQ